MNYVFHGVSLSQYQLILAEMFVFGKVEHSGRECCDK